MVAVRPSGGFSVNRLGVNAVPFPLTFGVREVDGYWLVAGTAAQASELADILAQAADTVAVMDIGTTSFLDEQYAQWTSSQIAAEQGTAYRRHDLGALATGVIGLSDEVLVMRGAEVPRFLADWSPYQLDLVGLPAEPDDDHLDEIALAIGTASGDGLLLPTLPGCCLWYSGHDDCYIWLETTDRRIALAVFGRLLALLAGSALAEAEPVEVAEPAETMVEALVAQSRYWIGALDVAPHGEVTVRLTATSRFWRLSDPFPEQVGGLTASYDGHEAAWRLAAM